MISGPGTLHIYGALWSDDKFINPKSQDLRHLATCTTVQSWPATGKMIPGYDVAVQGSWQRFMDDVGTILLPLSYTTLQLTAISYGCAAMSGMWQVSVITTLKLSFVNISAAMRTSLEHRHRQIG